MIEIKEAVQKAFGYIDMLYDGEVLPNKLLEEIEYDHEKDVWNVVVGFDSQRVIEKTEGPILIQAVRTKEKERKYKKVVMKGEDGAFVKMVDEML